ncbi:MAG: glycosyltransferase family 2 protein [Alphaproteobacteria bacterium]|nr:glycosyltransferase family 2 protein [Alphaproteobacteria bacterium]
MDVSIVIPARNEAGNIVVLVEKIHEAMDPGMDYEIIVVDDASDDTTVNIAKKIAADHPDFRLLINPANAGQSACVHSGVRAARGTLVCTLDGDGQNPPAELPKLLAPFFAGSGNEKLGLVAGQRVGRQDPVSKKVASRLANGLRSLVLKDNTRDTGCGLKAFRRDAFLELPYFNNMHRYLPALFKRANWRVVHVDVTHLPRLSGKSNYSNLQRGLVGIIDLLGVSWLIRRKKITDPKEFQTPSVPTPSVPTPKEPT